MKLGLQPRLILLVALVVTPALVAATYQFLDEQDERTTEVEAFLRALARDVAAVQVRLDGETQALLLGLSEVPAVRQSREPQCSRTLAEVRQASPYHLNLGVVDATGVLRCSAVPSPEAVDLSDRLHIQSALRGGGFAVGDYEVGEVTGRPGIGYALALRDGEEIVGALHATLDLQWLDDAVREVPLPEDAVVNLLDRDGVLVGRFPDADLLDRRFPAFERLRADQPDGRRIIVADGIDGLERMYAGVPLARPGHQDPAFVVIGAPPGVVLADARQRFRADLGILLGAAAVGVGAAWATGRRTILRPTRDLEDTARRIAAGDYGARTKSRDAPEEIASVGTALDAMARQVEAYIERMRAVDRLKSDFLNRAAHEFATPLTPVRIQLALLRRDAARLEPRHQQALTAIERNFERLLRLVDAILQAARVQAQALEVDRRPMDLGRLVERAVAAAAPAADAKGIRIDHAPRRALPVRGDAQRLAGAVGQLLENAIRFSPTGSTVHVEAGREGQHAVLKVRDEGAGLTRGQHKALFEPFAQVHDALEQTESGPGLGLYVAQAVVSLHGGVLSAESPGPGAGSTFTIRLPLDVE